MTIRELLNTGRKKLFLAVIPDGALAGDLLCLCPGSFVFEDEREQLLAKYPGLLDWLVVPDGPAVGYTEIVWKRLTSGDWVNAAGDIKTAAEMSKLDGTWDREIPIHKA